MAANTLWVAVGSGGGNTIATSTDGITWAGRGATVFNAVGRGVAYGNNLWVAVGYGEGNTIATSTDPPSCSERSENQTSKWVPKLSRTRF